MSTFSVRLPTAMKDRIDGLAQVMGRSRASLLCEAIEGYLELQTRHIAHIEKGLADLDAGRVHSHDEIKELVRDFERMA